MRAPKGTQRNGGALAKRIRHAPKRVKRHVQRGPGARVHQGGEETQQALYRIILQKAVPSRDNARNAVVRKAGFNLLKLPVRAAEHRDIRKRARNGPVVASSLRIQHIHAARHARNLLGNPDCLGKTIRRLHEADGAAGSRRGHKLALRARIVGDYAAGKGKDLGRGTVVF